MRTKGVPPGWCARATFRSGLVDLPLKVELSLSDFGTELKNYRKNLAEAVYYYYSFSILESIVVVD
jgi:hypothetical protein